MFLSFLFVVLGTAVAAVFFLPDYSKQVIETKLGPALGGTAQISQAKVVGVYPFLFRIKDFKVQSPALNGTAGEITVGIAWGPTVILKAKKANFEIRPESSPKKSAAEKTPGPPQIPRVLTSVGADIEVSDSKISVFLGASPIEVQNINFTLKMASINEPIVMSLATRATPIEGLTLPVNVNVQVKLENDNLVIKSADVGILSLKTNVTGFVNVQNKNIDLAARLQTSELEKIPLPAEAPIKKWAGAISLDARVIKTEKDPLPLVQGKFALTNLQVTPEIKNKNMEISGPVALSSMGTFKFTDKLTVESLKWNADLTALKASYSGIVEKPAGVKAASSGELSLQNQLNLKLAQVQFDQILFEASGIYNAKGPSDFSFNLKPTVLKGIEKYFPPIRDYPLEGSVESKGRVLGDLSQPQSVIVQLDSLLAKGVRGKFSYKSEKLQLTGMVTADVNGKLQAKGTNVQAGSARAFIDVSDMEIDLPNSFSKKKGQTLRLDIEAGKTGEEFQIKKGGLQTFFGNIEVRGRPPLSLSDNMNLKLVSGPLNLRLAAAAVSPLAKFAKAGDAKFDLSVKGKYNAEDFWSSPLAITGDIVVNLPEYKMAATKKDSSVEEKEQSPEELGPILPDTALVKGLNLKTKTTLGLFAMENLQARKIAVDAAISDKNFTVNVGSVGEVFGGAVNLKNVIVPLTQKNPLVQLQADFKGLDVISALSFVNPQWKDLAKGRLSGDVRGQTLLPGSKKFIDELKGQGKFSLTNGYLNTLNFEVMVKEKLSKIPGAEKLIPPAKGPLQANINGTYVLEKKVLRLVDFHAVTPRNEEMDIAGILGMDMSVDVRGKVVLVDWPGGGTFYEANKDDKGRINIPINIVGNIMNPELSFAGDTLKQMAAKVAEYEINKKRKGIENQLKKDFESKLKGLFNK